MKKLIINLSFFFWWFISLQEAFIRLELIVALLMTALPASFFNSLLIHLMYALSSCLIFNSNWLTIRILLSRKKGFVNPIPKPNKDHLGPSNFQTWSSNKTLGRMTNCHFVWVLESQKMYFRISKWA